MEYKMLIENILYNFEHRERPFTDKELSFIKSLVEREKEKYQSVEKHIPGV